MKTTNTIIIACITVLLLTSCGSGSQRKRNLDHTLFKYAAVIRWSDYDSALTFLKPGEKDILPSSFELEHLKQFKVSRYNESPIQPGATPETVSQTVRITLYNIHTNREREMVDHQIWEFDEEAMQWYLTTGIPQLK